MAGHINNGSQALARLDRELVDAFEPELYGFPWYASIDDPATRGVRSNQAIILTDAAAAHLEALADAAEQLRDLVGPNGRVMPTSAEAEERRRFGRVQAEITDGLRAAGSVLDALGGLTVLFLGLPIVPPLADSRNLLTCEPSPRNPTAEQREAVERVKSGVARALSAGPEGWLEWTIEARNAMVHRGRSLTTWLCPPARVDRSRIVLVTGMSPQRVMRSFPHLPRQPDLSDAESVLNGGAYEDVYLHEPAQDTLDGLALHCSALTASVTGVFEDLVDELAGFAWPAAEWAVQPRRDRARRADAFRGFDPTVPAADISGLVLNPREAKRLGPMERLALTGRTEEPPSLRQRQRHCSSAIQSPTAAVRSDPGRARLEPQA